MGARYSRRLFLAQSAGIAAAAGQSVPQIVPWSAGSEAPVNKSPKNAADCHHHIYDARFPIDPKAKLRPGNATVADYRLLQKRLDTLRHVIVQPSTYGLDNSCLLDALRQFGRQTTRAIAVVDTEVSNAQLKAMDAAGVCGIRFNLVQVGPVTLDMVEPLAKRIAAFGWHLQFNVSADQIVDRKEMWERLPVPLVFDHLGHVGSPANPAFGVLANLLHKGKCWVKLSGAYMDTKLGPPTYADSGAVAKAYLAEAPERLVWGTDWPHPTTNDKPDDALLFDRLREWCATEQAWRQVLVTNAAKLYGF